jgi:hypothetical protein
LSELPPPTNLFAAAGDVRVPPNAEGTVVLPKLAAGTYTVRLELEGEAEPLLTIDDVIVEAGGTVRPPELNPLDLRGALRTVTVRLVDRVGLPWNGQVYYRASGADDEAWRSQACLKGVPLKLVTASESLDVRGGADGMRMTDVVRASGEVTLVLEPGYPLRLELPGDLKLSEDDTLSVVLSPRGEHANDTIDVAGAFDRNGVCELVAAHAGVHDLRFRLKHAPNPFQAHSTGFTSEHASTLAVLGLAEGQRVRLDLTQADVGRARGE